MENLYNAYLERNKNINRSYRKLDVWKEAIDLFAMVRKKMKLLPTLSFKSKGQTEDSALGISSNIAEATCRRYLKETIQFNAIALGCLGENYSQLFALMKSEDIEPEWFEEYDKLHYSVENKLISMNKKYVAKLKESSDWHNDYMVREIVEYYDSIG